MATIIHNVTTPLSFKVATLVALVEGATDSDKLDPQVSEVTFTPTTQSNTWTGIGGNTVGDQSIATWAMTLGMIQDVAASGMLRWLLDNEGKKADFTALLTTGVTVEITATISPAVIGGPVGPGYLTSTVTLACDGKPVFTDAP
ncbi:MAG: hypothetical protein QM582_14060 [Micropruina sp.]|uniref:hypothetical protein n=1 Tax=Micropruina sp. TaxID=2737536 RepID=UPI0039E44808